MKNVTQESRTDKVAVSMTPREKLAVQLVAGARDTDVSNLIRDRVLPGVLEEAKQIRAALKAAA